MVVVYVVVFVTSEKAPPEDLTVLDEREYVTFEDASEPSVQVNVSLTFTSYTGLIEDLITTEGDLHL